MAATRWWRRWRSAAPHAPRALSITPGTKVLLPSLHCCSRCDCIALVHSHFGLHRQVLPPIPHHVGVLQSFRFFSQVRARGGSTCKPQLLMLLSWRRRADIGNGVVRSQSTRYFGETGKALGLSLFDVTSRRSRCSTTPRSGAGNSSDMSFFLLN